MIPDENKPNYHSSAYLAMSPAWKIVRDLSGGTRAMHEAGREYLPQERGEKPLAYDARLKRSVLFNAYRRTVEALVGLPFKADPAIIYDKVPAQIQADLEDIDLAGTHIDVFTKELFEDSFEGHAFILVDMDPLTEVGRVTAAPDLTRADTVGRRPFWRSYKVSDCINWQIDRVADVNPRALDRNHPRLEITQITFEEKTLEKKGRFGEEEVTRYRVFSKENGIVRWELFRTVKRENESETLEIERTGVTTLSRIPLAVVYGRRKGMLESEPTLLDQAYLNLSHYRQHSDYLTQIHAFVPILVRKGVPEEQRKKLEIGPNSLADIPENGDLFYRSHDAKATDSTRREILDTEQRMAMMGLSLLSQRVDSNITATEKRQDWQQETSHLSTMVRSLKDAVELALQFHAEYRGLPTGGEIQLAVADDDLSIDGTLFTALMKATSGPDPVLSRETFYALLQRGFKGVDFQNEPKRVLAMIAKMKPKEEPVVPMREKVENEEIVQ